MTTVVVVVYDEFHIVVVSEETFLLTDKLVLISAFQNFGNYRLYVLFVFPSFVQTSSLEFFVDGSHGKQQLCRINCSRRNQ